MSRPAARHAILPRLQIQASAALSSSGGWLCRFQCPCKRLMSPGLCCRAVGITVTVLAGVQWLTSVFWRPNRDVQLRRWWNIWHRSWGRIALALAIANIYTGLYITQPGTRYYVGQTVVFGVLFALVSSAHSLVMHLQMSAARECSQCAWSCLAGGAEE